MKKGSGTKTRISVTLDNELVDSINDICEKRYMKISNYIEMILKKGVEHEKKKR